MTGKHCNEICENQLTRLKVRTNRESKWVRYLRALLLKSSELLASLPFLRVSFIHDFESDFWNVTDCHR